MNMNKKLLIISLCTTGVMRDHFICYAKHFSNFFDLYCITNDNVTNDELNAVNTLNVKYKRNEKFSYLSFKKIHQIKSFIKQICPDLIYVFTPHPINIMLANFLKNYKIVFQVHDPKPHSGTPFLDSIIIKKQLKQYYKISKRLIVAGDKLKEDIINKYPKYSNKITSIKFAVLDNQIYTIEHKNPINDILFFGRIEKYKGINILIDALKLLNYKYKCVIVGKGNIDAICKSSINNDNIIIKNEYISDYDLAKEIANSKVVVLPYLDATGSMTIGLSFCYGKPVIASDVGIFKEYINDSGIILKENNPEQLAYEIDNLLSNKEKLNQLSTNALKRSELFDINLIIKENVEIFKKIINEEEIKND